MSIRFAPARKIAPQPVSRAFVLRHHRAAANDNALSVETLREREVLHDALRHFAEYGLGAAREAHLRAEEAFFAGDRTSYDRWLEICRLLDARVARQLQRQMEPSRRSP